MQYITMNVCVQYLTAECTLSLPLLYSVTHVHCSGSCPPMWSALIYWKKRQEYQVICMEQPLPLCPWTLRYTNHPAMIFE